MKKIVYIDMDNVLVDFESGLRKVEPYTLDKYMGNYDEIPGLFSYMEPMAGAIEAVHKLAEKYDLYILSTAPWNNPIAWAEKRIWVGRYLDDIFHKRLIISHCKNLCEGDYLIDDREKNGAAEFKGELIAFGSEKYPDWNSVVNYLMSKE